MPTVLPMLSGLVQPSSARAQATSGSSGGDGFATLLAEVAAGPVAETLPVDTSSMSPPGMLADLSAVLDLSAPVDAMVPEAGVEQLLADLVSGLAELETTLSAGQKPAPDLVAKLQDISQSLAALLPSNPEAKTPTGEVRDEKGPPPALLAQLGERLGRFAESLGELGDEVGPKLAALADKLGGARFDRLLAGLSDDTGADTLHTPGLLAQIKALFGPGPTGPARGADEPTGPHLKGPLLALAEAAGPEAREIVAVKAVRSAGEVQLPEAKLAAGAQQLAATGADLARPLAIAQAVPAEPAQGTQTAEAQAPSASPEAIRISEVSDATLEKPGQGQVAAISAARGDGAAPASEFVPTGDPARATLMPALGGPRLDVADARAVAQAYGSQQAQLNVPQMAFDMTRQIQAGNSQFQIRLDPADLGRVDVKLEIDASGAANARLVVEKSETLDLLMRDQRTLERALAQAGLDGARTTLEFSLRQQGQGQRHGEPAFLPEGPPSASNDDVADAPVPARFYRAGGSASGLNILA